MRSWTCVIITGRIEGSSSRERPENMPENRRREEEGNLKPKINMV